MNRLLKWLVPFVVAIGCMSYAACDRTAKPAPAHRGQKMRGVSGPVPIPAGGTTGAVQYNNGANGLAGNSDFTTDGSGNVAANSFTGTWQGSPVAAAYVGNLPASQITSGHLAVGVGGTGANLAATGPGVLQQATAGAAFTSLATATGNTSGALVLRDGSGNFAGEIGTFTHLETDTTTSPSFTAGGNLGTSPTVTYSGTDVAFTLTVQPGSSGQSGTTVGTVTYTKAFAKAPAVVPIPQNAIAANVSGNLHIYVISTPTGFTIFTGGGNLTNLSASSWIFLSIG